MILRITFTFLSAIGQSKITRFHLYDILENGNSSLGIEVDQLSVWVQGDGKRLAVEITKRPEETFDAYRYVDYFDSGDDLIDVYTCQNLSVVYFKYMQLTVCQLCFS